MTSNGPIENIVCGGCECVCDDLRAVQRDGQLTEWKNNCPRGEAWFAANLRVAPTALIDGVPCTVDVAIAHAAAILKNAHAPLVYGLLNNSTEAVRAAIELAEMLGGTIDIARSTATLTATQEVGQSTCTLGDVRHRADLILLWGCNPALTHPRLMERVIDTATSRPVRTIHVIDRGQPHFDIITELRLILAGQRTDSAWQPLAAAMSACKYGVIFFGPLAVGPSAHRTSAALFQLVRELNEGRRFHAMGLSEHGDIAGAADMLAWQTGYAAAVDSSAGYPQSWPGVTDAATRLACGEVDVALILGPECVTRLPAAAKAHLASIPVVAIGTPASPKMPAAVTITTAVPGIHATSTARRLDGVTLPLKMLLPASHLEDSQVLCALLAAIS
jgi:formylmethanofuran dehydrogenase subunit B